MSDLLYVVIFASLGGLVSLIGGLFILRYRHFKGGVANYAAPFAAGALLSAAFLDLLPEAVANGNNAPLTFALFGILAFFLLERYLRWFHHHHEHDEGDHNASLVIIGDTVHNFIDGLVIGSAFLVNIETGIVASIAVASHEIPQEIGDFGILIKKSFSNRKIIIVNLLSSLATTISAVSLYIFVGSKEIDFSPLLGLAAGFFIYIAVSDIIPSIHSSEQKHLIGTQTLMLIIGVIIVAIFTISL